MNIVLLDRDTLGNCDLSRLNEFGNLKIYPQTSHEQTLSRCENAEIIITNKVILDKQILSNLPKLKLICISATGMNNVDLEYAKSAGIVVKNVAGYSTSSVAQHTITLVLNALSQISYYDNYCKSGEWAKSEIFVHINDDINGLRELENLQWGIIGFGSIGQRVATLASAFGANISYFSTSGKNTNKSYPQKSLEALLSQSDIISIHAPLNGQTKNLLNAKNLTLLKDRAILVNVGRGGIVNELDIANILKTKNIYFATDVLESEPMKPNHPLLDKSIHSKLILTPHIAWAYDNARKRLIDSLINNIKEFLA